MWLCSLPFGTPTPQTQGWTSFVQGKPGKMALQKHWGGPREPVEETEGASGAHRWGMQIISGCIWKPAHEDGLKQGQALCFLLQIHILTESRHVQVKPAFRWGCQLCWASPGAARPWHCSDSSSRGSWKWDIPNASVSVGTMRALNSPSFLSQGKPNRERNPCLLCAALCSHHLQSLPFKRTWISQTAVLENEGEIWYVRRKWSQDSCC